MEGSSLAEWWAALYFRIANHGKAILDLAITKGESCVVRVRDRWG